MADTSTLGILLKNIKANLQDSANYLSIATALKYVGISPIFYIHSKTSPQAIIVPGARPAGGHDGGLTEQEIEVTVYIVILVPKNKWESVMAGTSGIEAIDSISEKARSALDRPAPYKTDHGLPTGASYTAQGNVTGCEYAGTDAPDITDDYGIENFDGVMALYIPMKLAYTYYELRNG